MPKQLNTSRIIRVTSVVIFVVFSVLLFRTEPQPAANNSNGRSLILFCAAGMRLPIEAIRQAFEKECGIRVDVQYGGSNTLLSQMQVSRKADLYLAADRTYVERAREMGLIREMT